MKERYVFSIDVHVEVDDVARVTIGCYAEADVDGQGLELPQVLFRDYELKPKSE